MRVARIAFGAASIAVLFANACGGTSTPPVDTPKTLPPAEPPADLSRDTPVDAADAGKPDQKPKSSADTPTGE